MLKRGICAGMILIFLLAAPVACVTSLDLPVNGLGHSVSDITFETPVYGANTGIGRIAKTAGAAYYFQAGYTEEECAKWARNAELLTTVAFERYGIKRPGTTMIYFYDERNGVFNTTANHVYINTGDAGIIGALFQHLSGQRLPAWLCTGLELYWLDRLGAELLPGGFDIDKDADAEGWLAAVRDAGLPEFGDRWFLPGYIPEPAADLKALAPQIAYAFVKYLSDSGLLDDVVGMYMAKPWPSHGDIMESEGWLGFFGKDDNNAGYERTYYATYGTSVGYTIRPAFISPARYGVYYFDITGVEERLDYERLERLVDAAEDGVAFAVGWFDIEFDFDAPITVFMRPQNDVFAGKVDEHGRISLSGYFEYSENSITGTAAHEAAHVLLDIEGIHSNFPIPQAAVSQAGYLEEGLCQYIMYLYTEYNGMFENAPSKGDFTGFEAAYDFFNGVYEPLAGKPLVESPVDLTAYAHVMAIIEHAEILATYGPDYFTAMKENYGNAAGMKTEYSNVHYIYSYWSGASFVAYLMNLGTKDEFFAFYQDVGQAKALYGKDLTGLIDCWAELLGLEI